MEFHFKNLLTGKTRSLPIEEVKPGVFMVDNSEGAGSEVRQDDAFGLDLKPDRMFPMRDGPDIPWSLAEKIHIAYTKIFELYGPDNDLDRGLDDLAMRGGFSWNEVAAMSIIYKRRFGRLPDEWR